jgi:hypothetical protein
MTCERCWNLRRVLVPVCAQVIEEKLCRECAAELESPDAGRMRDLAYEMRRAELLQQSMISGDRMRLAMRSKSARRLEVPMGGLFEEQTSLFGGETC